MILREVSAEQAYRIHQEGLHNTLSGKCLAGICFPNFSWKRYIALEHKCRRENSNVVGTDNFVAWMTGYYDWNNW